MKPESLGVRGIKDRGTTDRWNAAATYRREERAQDENGAMTAEVRSRLMEAAAAHPVAELLACPPDTGNLLSASARTMTFETGDVIFRQSATCAGLYLVVQGLLQRRTERLEIRVTLGQARPGDLVELAAALGDRRHTYSLVAQSSGSLLMLPVEALHNAFESYPPLRMQLLEELAREVSRAYYSCSVSRGMRARRSRESTFN
jgi:CRP-like cAMP-binding protein